MSAFSLQAPPKERQQAIDAYFSLSAGKQTLMQRNPNPVTPAVKSQYFQNDPNTTLYDTDMSSYFSEDIDMQNAPHHSAVSVVPVAPGTPSQNPFRTRQQRRVTFANQDSDDFQTSPYAMHQPQTVPVLKSSFRKIPSSILKTPVGSVKTQPTRGSKNLTKDPSKVHSGGIRLRSIQYARSVVQVADKSILESPKVGKEFSSVALVEVIGVLVTRMRYGNNCWDFSVRDPTNNDFMRKYPVATIPTLGYPLMQQFSGSDPTVLQCRMFDNDGLLHQDALERDEVLRIIGIVPQTSATEDDRDYQILCVGIRTANVDEVRLVIEGCHRGLVPKRA
ncbi:hypothetical protein KVV02_006855 [Mortierella alpina]|uniref:Uncharacterized protein n=1 Tax=Mortierella alpina TaxID=64518 RepID=A0A9P8AAU3_MORAP|nr:hypothetical protein KVV02_006855 [Mortierella alpina]